MKRSTARYIAKAIVKKYNKVRMDLDHDNTSEKANRREGVDRLLSDFGDIDKG